MRACVSPIKGKMCSHEREVDSHSTGEIDQNGVIEFFGPMFYQSGFVACRDFAAALLEGETWRKCNRGTAHHEGTFARSRWRPSIWRKMKVRASGEKALRRSASSSNRTSVWDSMNS